MKFDDHDAIYRIWKIIEDNYFEERLNSFLLLTLHYICYETGLGEW